MKKKLNDFVKGEAFKMRDIAPGPAIGLMLIPKVLIVIVAVIVIFAIIKIVKISNEKKRQSAAVGNAVQETAAVGSAAAEDEKDKVE